MNSTPAVRRARSRKANAYRNYPPGAPERIRAELELALAKQQQAQAEADRWQAEAGRLDAELFALEASAA